MGSFPKRIRVQAFARAHGACEDCGRRLNEGWQLDVHHEQPTSFGGADTIDNAVVVCLECHAARHEAWGMRRAVASIRARIKSSYGGHTRDWIRRNQCQENRFTQGSLWTT